MIQDAQAQSIPFNELLPYAALSGVMGFVPIPFVDGYVMNQAKAAMLKKVAAEHDLKIDRFALRVLMGRFDNGPVLGVRAALGAVRFVFRKTLVMVNAASCADEAMQTFLLGRH